MRGFFFSVLGAALLLWASPGCTGDDSGAMGGSGGSAASGGSGASDGGFNLGGSAAQGGGHGCEYVDLVFAVDSSGSMQEEREELADTVFPAFAAQLLAIPGIIDFRAAVLDACPDPANYHTQGRGGPCNFESGEVWMTSASSDIAGEFACVANIYVDDMNCTGDNDDEQPAVAAVTSLEEPFKSGPNNGFLRDEALLVIVTITDEDETPVPTQTAQQIYDRFVAAKGDANNVVFLGIGGAVDCDGFYGHAEEATMLKELVDLFAANGRGVFWDICEGQLEDGLAEALSTVETACGEFIPPE